MTKEEIEEISTLRAHPGWVLLRRRYEEALKDIEASAIEQIETLEQLWKAKGWREAVLEILDEPDAARASLDDLEL